MLESSYSTKTRRRGRSRTARPVTTQQVYRDIADLQATLYQMRNERRARQAQSGLRFSPRSPANGRGRARHLSPVIRWETRGQMGRSMLQSPIRQTSSPDAREEESGSREGTPHELHPDRDYRCSVSRGRNLIKAVHHSASRGRSMLKEKPESVGKQSMMEKKEKIQSKATGGKRERKSGVSPGMTLAERTKVRLQEKERNLQRIKNEMMEECTFSPETNHSSSTATSVRSQGSSQRKTTGKQPKLVTPQSSKTNDSSSPPTVVDAENRTSPESLGKSSVSTTMSSRIQELYLDGVRRNRAFTDKTEEEMRKRRLEEKELEMFCTFKPNMNWRKKTQPAEKREPSTIEYNHRLAPKDTGSDVSMGTLTLCSLNDMPPVEVFAKKPDIGYETPPQVTIIVSDKSIEECLHKAPVNKRLAPEFDAARSVDTEYASV